MRRTSRDNLVIVGGPGSGKSTVADLLVGARLFSVTASSYGPFGHVAELGDGPTRAVWMPGRERHVAVDPEAAPRLDRAATFEHLVWLERPALPPRRPAWERIAELSLGAFERRERRSWFERWAERAVREIHGARSLLVVVEPRGLGRADALALERLSVEIPAVRDVPAVACLNCFDDAEERSMSRLADSIGSDLSYLLPVSEVVPVRARLARRDMRRARTRSSHRTERLADALERSRR